MDHREVGQFWNQNADNWTRLARMGSDIYRDRVNTPAFLEMMPPVTGKRGLDIGCGEGHNTRLLAGAGATMTAIDIAERFIHHAQTHPEQRDRAINYQLASAVSLPFADCEFDFATAFMSFMDIPEHEKVISEAHRVLKPGGWLQFSISHPCFSTLKWNWVLDEQGNRKSLECGDYFESANGNIEEWIFSGAPKELRETLPEFKVPRFTRTLSSWLNKLIGAGFSIERFAEPFADDETIEKWPHVADTRIISYFLIIRCRKSHDPDRGADHEHQRDHTG